MNLPKRVALAILKKKYLQEPVSYTHLDRRAGRGRRSPRPAFLLDWGRSLLLSAHRSAHRRFHRCAGTEVLVDSARCLGLGCLWEWSTVVPSGRGDRLARRCAGGGAAAGGAGVQRACRRLPVFFFPQKGVSLGLPQQACRPHDRSTPTQGGACALPSQVPSHPRFPHPPRRLSCPSALILSLPQKAVQKRRLPRAAARAGGAAGQGGKQAAFEGGGATPPSGGSAARPASRVLGTALRVCGPQRRAGGLWKGRGGHRMRGEGRDAELSVCPGNGESDDLPDAGGAGRGFPGRRGPVSKCPPGGRRARSRGRGVSARGGSALV